MLRIVLSWPFSGRLTARLAACLDGDAVVMAMAKQDTELVALLYPACPAVNCCYFNAIFKWNANCLMISIGKLLEYLTRGTRWYQERQINHFGVAINECPVIMGIDIKGFY